MKKNEMKEIEKQQIEKLGGLHLELFKILFNIGRKNVTLGQLVMDTGPEKPEDQNETQSWWN